VSWSGRLPSSVAKAQADNCAEIENLPALVLGTIRTSQLTPLLAFPAKEAARKLAASQPCVLRDAPSGAPQHEGGL
jgi:hypothetical protein